MNVDTLKVGQRIVVTVTHEHNQSGQRNSTSSCPFAHALRDLLGEPGRQQAEVTVGGYAITIYTLWGRVKFSTSQRFFEAVRDFDSQGKPIPIGNYRLTVKEVHRWQQS